MLTSRKHLFSIPGHVHYLNCAYLAPVPRAVEEAAIASLARLRNPDTVEPSDFFEDKDEVRRRFARLIELTSPECVAVIPSVSYGIAGAARNTPIARGQNIVIVADQFPSNVYIWRRLAEEKNAELRIVRRPAAREAAASWSAAIAESIDSSTAAVAMAQAHWTDGTLFDLTRIGSRAREVGAAFIVDGTQTVGAFPCDVREIRPDALVCGGYKWLLGPYGTAVAYYGQLYDAGVPIEEAWLSRAGSEDFRRLVDYRDGYRPAAARYDAGGSSNFVAVPMLKAALGLLLEWDAPEIQRYCEHLIEPLVAFARDRGWGISEDGQRVAHILGLRLPESVDTEVLRAELSKGNVVVSLRGEALRISPHVYNDEDDIAALIEALEGLEIRD